jgi:hypothetical protein
VKNLGEKEHPIVEELQPIYYSGEDIIGDQVVKHKMGEGRY